MINPTAYYTVQGWMLSELGLKGNALAVYAIIYGFSQDGASEYSGSARYLAEWLGCTTRTILAVLADLTERGLLKKTTTYKNGQTFNNYAVAKTAKEDPQQPSEKISYPMKKFQGGSENISGGPVKNFQGGSENISSHITRDNNRKINIEINKAPAEPPAPPAPPAEEGKKPPKHKHGQYKHVLLTDEEYAKLVAKYTEEFTAKLIKHLDEYIEEKGYKSKSHYLAIGRWVVSAVKEKEQREGRQTHAPARGGRQAGPVGPNGIHIDPSKTDLDAHF